MTCNKNLTFHKSITSMQYKTRILFGIITKAHTEIALDELYGLQDLGFICDQFEYGSKNKFDTKFGRFYIVVKNAITLVIKTYKFKPDVIYFNSTVEFIASTRDFISIFILKSFYYKKVKLILKSHGSEPEILASKKLFYSKVVSPFLKKHIDGWLFLSTEEIKWILLKKLIDPNKIFLAKNIVRIEKFKSSTDFKKELNISSETKVLLFVGRLIKAKGIHYILDAFAEIKDKYNLVLLVVGDGEELQEVQNKIEFWGMKKKVILTGWIDEKQVAYYTSNCDILVFPTFHPEGFPMALFNSVAAGLPIITTPIRAAADYLKEPENCIWVKPRSTSSIKSAIIKLLEYEPLRQQMKINNKLKANLFTKKVVAKELSSIVNAIISNKYNSNFIEVKDHFDHSSTKSNIYNING